MDDFATIDEQHLDDITGGNRIQLLIKGAQYAGRGARWAWNEVIRPGLVWAGIDSLADRATGNNQPQQGH